MLLLFCFVGSKEWTVPQAVHWWFELWHNRGELEGTFWTMGHGRWLRSDARP